MADTAAVAVAGKQGKLPVSQPETVDAVDQFAEDIVGVGHGAAPFLFSGFRYLAMPHNRIDRSSVFQTVH